jgi:16S rRNA (cytosine967-C5)-methyltransferase
LLGVDRGRTTLSLELERQRGELDEDRDRALLFELVAGTLRWRNELDALLAACTTRRLGGVDAPVLAALRLGAYQLAHLDRIPPHAVVHEAVELARELGRARATGFVNAVLRRLARGRPPQAVPIRPEPKASRVNQLAYLTTTLSHPAWLAERWLDRYGFEAAERWCQFNNESPDVTLRSLGRLTPLEVLAALAKVGVAGVPTRWVRDAIQVPPGSTGRLPAELMRELAIQDEASQIVAHALGATPDERVLDACAAPGGKTVVIASDMRRRGVIVAADHRPRRLSVLRAVLDRAGVDAPIVQIDATRPLPFGAVFDAVLLDAPCSGLGTLRRDPDLKWSRQPAHLAAFAAAQRDMLAAVASVVRPGGRLLYSTCSSEPEENEQVVTAFLATHSDFSAVPTVPGPAVADAEQLVDDRGFLRTLPFRDRLDAFYAALLVRRRGA